MSTGKSLIVYSTVPTDEMPPTRNSAPPFGCVGNVAEDRLIQPETPVIVSAVPGDAPTLPLQVQDPAVSGNGENGTSPTIPVASDFPDPEPVFPEITWPILPAAGGVPLVIGVNCCVV
jgi:hypothetical protein